MDNVLLKDKNGLEIFEGDIFTFNFLENLDETIKLTGSFSFNVDELAFEIDVKDNDRYVCLTYATCNILISNIEKC